jgi:hypothetical protein
MKVKQTIAKLDSSNLRLKLLELDKEEIPPFLLIVDQNYLNARAIFQFKELLPAVRLYELFREIDFTLYANPLELDYFFPIDNDKEENNHGL